MCRVRRTRKKCWTDNPQFPKATPRNIAVRHPCSREDTTNPILKISILEEINPVMSGDKKQRPLNRM